MSAWVDSKAVNIDLFDATMKGSVRTKDPLLDFRLSDAVTFLAVQRQGSLSAAARELRVTVSQVSKAINRLERQLNTKLLARTSRGVALSPDGSRVAPFLESALARLREAERREDTTRRLLTVAGPSYVIGHLGASAAVAMPQLRLRLLQLSPGAMRANAASELFDVAFLLGDGFRLDNWETIAIGPLQHALFAPPDVAKRLGRQPVAPERLAQESFVTPLRSANGVFVPLDDGCPLPFTARRQGHEAQTIGLALELAIAGSQVVFGPVAAALSHVNAGLLVPVSVEGWSSSETLSMAVNVDRVTAPSHEALRRLATEYVEAMRVEAPERSSPR